MIKQINKEALLKEKTAKPVGFFVQQSVSFHNIGADFSAANAHDA